MKNSKKDLNNGQAKVSYSVVDTGYEIPEVKTQDFVSWLIVERGCNPDYAKGNNYNLNRLLVRVNCPNPQQKDAERIVTWIHTSDFSKSHKRHLLRALELYLEYKGIKNNSGQLFKFKKPQAKKLMPHYLTRDEIKMIIGATRDYREYAVISLFLTTGMRLMELLSLNIEDVDFDRKLIRVKHAKFDKQREIPLGKETETILSEYIEKYHGLKSKPGTPLFRSIRGNRLSAHACARIVVNCGVRAGITTHVSPHVLRHSFATAMLSNGCDIFHLSHILGHTDIATTAIYLHINDASKQVAFNKGVPRLV